MGGQPIVIAVPAVMTPEDVRALGMQVEELFQHGRSVVCDVRGSDFSVVDALARIHLLSRREGGVLQVRGGELAELLKLAGLSEVCGQPDSGEEGLDVEKVINVGDPSR